MPDEKNAAAAAYVKAPSALAAPTAAPPPSASDKKVRLTQPYGFYEDAREGEAPNLRMWLAGQTVTDAADVKLLEERGAPIEAVTE